MYVQGIGLYSILIKQLRGDYTMNAYDYNNQVWVSGVEGARLLITQLQEHLSALSKPGYAMMLGIRDINTERTNVMNQIQQAREVIEGM